MSFKCPKCSNTSYSEASFRDHLRWSHGVTAEQLASSRRSNSSDDFVDFALGVGVGMLVDSIFDSGSSSDSFSSSDWSGGGGESGGGGASSDW